MRRPRVSYEERVRLLKKIDLHQLLDKRRRRLYNIKYRKSFLFVSILIGRLAYVSLFVIVSFLHFEPGEQREEIVMNKKIESQTTTSRTGSIKITTLYIETNYGNYTSNLGENRPPDFKSGDKLFIERNIFNKPIYFSKTGWYLKYGLQTNFTYYFIILFITLISFFFNDGLDRFTDKILLITSASNILGIMFYFLT